MKKKKIGIVTHYYQSTNYGGNLQAYALCAVLLGRGYEAEQICFPLFERNFKYRFISKNRKELLKSVSRKLKRVFLLPFRRKLLKEEREKFQQVYKEKKKAFYNFNLNLIPHNDKMYSNGTIGETIPIYDAFITGSDQVWNFLWYNPIFFLAFVPKSKLKISYAASMAMDSLSKKQANLVKMHLESYKAVSVREKESIALLKDISPVEVKLVLDPTLLLSCDDWDQVCADRFIEDDYVFCYFLGSNPNERKIAEEFAKKRGLKLVAIPPINILSKTQDEHFGDMQLYDASPEQFLSLIKHAKYVFTDSFHAVVFSNIYQKQYFVFNRSAKAEMSSRITDITALFHQEERFCTGKERESLTYVESLSNIDYTKENKDFEKLKKESIEFLENNLKD